MNNHSLPRRLLSPPVEVGRDVGAVVQAVRVLRTLAASSSPLSLSAISKEARVSASTTLNILRTLTNEGILRFEERTKSYSLDLGLLEIARPLLNRSHAELLQPHLLRIATRYSAVVTIWQVSELNALLSIGRAIPDVTVRLEVRLASKLPVCAGAVGRAVVAKLNISEDELEPLYQRVRWQVPLSFSEYHEQVQEARLKGYACDRGHLIRGVDAVGAAFTSSDGVTIIGVSAIVLADQHGPEDLQDLGTALADVCDWAAAAIP